MSDMELRILIFGGAVALGVLLGLKFRLKAIVLGLVAIFCTAVLGIFVGYGLVGEKLGFYFGVASMAIPILGAVVVVAAAVAQAVFKR